MRYRALFFAQIIVLVFLINACAMREYVELPPFNQKTFQINTQNETFLLYVTHGESYTFAMFDILGAPVAHREFSAQGFRNARFLPPDSSYDDMFYYILKMIENAQTTAFYESNILVEEIEY